MIFFLDTANVEWIREMNEVGVISGVTTNPSLIAHEGKELIPTIKEICDIVDGPISVEVLALKADGMIKEALKLVKIHKNIVIKIPMLREGMKAVNYLSKQGIKTNVTTVFSANQALLAASVGATYVSPFVGKCDEYSINGMEAVRQISKIYKIYGIKTKIIAASMRSPAFVQESALAGADIATVPYPVMNMMFNHPLTDICVEMFLNQWKEAMGEAKI
jgi:transaldolase